MTIGNFCYRVPTFLGCRWRSKLLIPSLHNSHRNVQLFICSLHIWYVQVGIFVFYRAEFSLSLCLRTRVNSLACLLPLVDRIWSKISVGMRSFSGILMFLHQLSSWEQQSSSFSTPIYHSRLSYICWQTPASTCRSGNNAVRRLAPNARHAILPAKREYPVEWLLTTLSLLRQAQFQKIGIISIVYEWWKLRWRKRFTILSRRCYHIQVWQIGTCAQVDQQIDFPIFVPPSRSLLFDACSFTQ